MKASTSPSLTALVMEVRKRASRVEGKVTSGVKRSERGGESRKREGERSAIEKGKGRRDATKREEEKEELTLLSPLLQKVLSEHDILLCQSTASKEDENESAQRSTSSSARLSLLPSFPSRVEVKRLTKDQPSTKSPSHCTSSAHSSDSNRQQSYKYR